MTQQAEGNGDGPHSLSRPGGGDCAVRPLINAPIASGQRDGKDKATTARDRQTPPLAERATSFNPRLRELGDTGTFPGRTDGSTDDRRRTIRGVAASAVPAAFAGPVPVTVTTFRKFLLVEATFSWRGTKQDTKYEGRKERDRLPPLRPRGSLTPSLHDLALSQVSRRADCHSQPVFTAPLSVLRGCKFVTPARGPGRGTSPYGWENQGKATCDRGYFVYVRASMILPDSSDKEVSIQGWSDQGLGAASFHPQSVGHRQDAKFDRLAIGVVSCVGEYTCR